jgi:hypothetical protein
MKVELIAVRSTATTTKIEEMLGDKLKDTNKK